MAKVLKPQTDSKTTATKKKTKAPAGIKNKTTAYGKFNKHMTAKLKEENPEMDADDRRAEISRLWKIDESNPKNKQE
ncbi:hypothetical protein JCM10207_006365 [Rhodosporidiobolus poonsookiae]